jgi:molybdate transport system substrate-binding protein
MRRARIDGAVAAVAVLVALTVATGLSACGSGSSASGSGKASSGPVIVSAAASLQDAFTTFGQSVQPAPRFSFAGSDELAAQIEQGVKPDVFASANTKLPDQLYAKGLVQKPRVFAGNRLVLAVPGDGKVKSIADAAKPGVTIAIGSASVPIGAYTRQVLGKLGAQGAAILKNVRSEEPDVKGVVGKLTQGAVDAGFVYVTDVEATEGQLHAVDLPQDASPVVAYGIAIVKGAKHPQAAKEFVDGIMGAKGQHVLEAAGFAPPPGS